MKKDREVDLRELLYYALKRWRVILIIALAVAVIFGVRMIVPKENDKATDEAIEKATAELETLQKRLDEQIEYNENSFFMKLDPLNKYRATFELCINAQSDSEAPEAYFDTNAANRITAAYSSYLTSNDFYGYVMEKINPDADLQTEGRYLREVIWETADNNAAAITINISGASEEWVEKALDAVKQAIEGEYPEIKSQIGNHSYNIIMESIHSVIDRDLEKAQSNYIKMTDEYKTQIEEKQAEVASLGAPVNTQGGLSARQLVKTAVKAVAVAFVTALFVIVCYMACGLFSNKMWNNGSWASFSIPVVGEIFANNKKCNKFDRWISKLTGCKTPVITMDESCALAAKSAAAALRQNGEATAAIISLADKEACMTLVNGMNKAEPDAFKFAGNIIADSKAIELLSESKEVIFLADGEKTSVEEVNKAVNLLSAWGKKLLGVILVK